MEVEISKKSYYLPKKLMDSFAQWCKPGRDYSPKIAGAIFFYMQLPADLREACEKAAYSDDIKKAVRSLSPDLKWASHREYQERFEKLLANVVALSKKPESRRKLTGPGKAQNRLLSGR
jgi:hypothetical protein